MLFIRRRRSDAKDLLFGCGNSRFFGSAALPSE
jgi:hypothetical protein